MLRLPSRVSKYDNLYKTILRPIAKFDYLRMGFNEDRRKHGTKMAEKNLQKKYRTNYGEWNLENKGKQ